MEKTRLSFLITCLFAIMATVAHAQIVLHEAADVTQTKATLSADFPDFSVEHGFQYKYGTLPEIDEFSKLALLSVSDPVQINTTGNAWSARIVKGWVESKSNLSVGQASIMSAKVTFSEPTTVTFEWSVDSEEGIGILSFIVDGETVREISGAVDFTQVSYQATAGEHILQWQYEKTAATNVGLDLGMVRKIDLQNTTEGEWINVTTPTSELRLNNLYPGQDYIYKAYSGESGAANRSSLKSFSTLPIQIGDVTVKSVTQSTATIDSKIELGDAEAEINVIFGQKKKCHLCGDLLKKLIGKDSTLIDFGFSSGWNTTSGSSIRTQNTYHQETITASFILAENTTVSFSWNCYGYQGNSLGSKTSSMYFYVDEEQIAKISKKSKDNVFDEVSVELSSGYHELKWVTNLAGGTPSWPACAEIRYLDIDNVSEFSEIPDSIRNIALPIKKEGLVPNTTYGVYIQTNPTYESDLTEKWINGNSSLTIFTTQNVASSVQTAMDIKQASATIRGKVDGGDATVIAVGLQYKDATGTRWTDYPKNMAETELAQELTRLKPNTTYQYRSYIQAQGCDTMFSEVGEFTTLTVEALKPTVVRLAQHEVELQGIVRFGDASIYQRGMQFRKSGETKWVEIEDGGNDSIYTLVKKNLEMGTKYEARTYIQPAGFDIIYSDVLEFTTLDNYFTGSLKTVGTQTTVGFSATLADLDEGITVEEYGFEYYLDSDGFFENDESFIESDVIRIPVVPENGQITTTVIGLTPYYGLRFRAYIKINGEYIYYTSYKDWTWDYAGTERATIKVSVKELTQTSVKLELDAIQGGDAVVSQIEYAFAQSVQDTEEYQVCGNELSINNLTPNTKYNLRFRGTVNGRLCPLLLDIEWDYSWFEFTTKAINIYATFTNITQTKATLEVNVDAGDAEVTDLKYSLNNGTYTDCGATENLVGLKPGTQYTVSFMGAVNGMNYYWATSPNTTDAYKFTTRPVSVSAHLSVIEQTSAAISWSYDCGDAIYVSSGIDYGTTIAMTESVSGEEGEIRLTELMPNTTYYWRAYVETEEGGKVYSSRNSFRTSAINCATLPVSNISNRSATMNGTIDCDGYSSAEFGFQWKQMEGWNSDPAFTKGVKNENGSISVALVNGMLEPNTDYQYRAAVRYKGNIYYADNWETFRTESEFVYYPASVHTMYRTNRENNCLVLCGYYVAGSEDVVAQGYEYWNTSSSARTKRASAANNVIQITTDESMQYSLDLRTLPDGSYSVRAFVKTSSGATIYGETLSFGVQGGTIASIGNIETDEVRYSVSNHILSIYNAANMSCTIYNLQGQIVEYRRVMTDNERFSLASGGVYIVRLSNGITYMVFI